MGMRVSTNVTALAAHRHLARTDGALSRSLERLSSGHRVNRAADDAAGLGISQGLRAQIGGMTRAVRNTQDGISLVQTAEGALAETTALLQRMRDLAVQAANDGSLDGRASRAVQGEVDQLKAELDRIAGTTTFHGRPLLDGTYRGTFQVGANVGETLTVVIGPSRQGMGVAGLGLSGVDVTGPSGAALAATVTPAVSDAEGTPSAGRLALAGDFTTAGIHPASFRGLSGTLSYAGRTFDLASVDYTGAVTATDHITALNLAAYPVLGTTGYPFVGTGSALYFTGDTPGPGSTAADAAALTPAYTARTGAGGALPVIDAAISRVSSLRADLGAIQNRMEHTIARLGVSIENTTASESRIRDTDMAAEMTVFARDQVRSQAGTAMLAQANQTPRTILELLG